jgi:hypothetical protein
MLLNQHRKIQRFYSILIIPRIDQATATETKIPRMIIFGRKKVAMDARTSGNIQ